MANVLVSETSMTAIANAIRSKNGTQNTYTPSQMPQAISEIEGGGSATLIDKNISANGTYNASSDSADGYKKVVVNVPTSGITQADEGKVVSNGALVSQTSLGVASNGIYDTTLNNVVNVNVPTSNVQLDPLSVTQNGSYEPASGHAYNYVTVNVSGGGSSALYNLASFNSENNMQVEHTGNHMKLEFTSNVSNCLLNLRSLRLGTAQSLTNMPKWFTIPVGTCVIAITNITNASGITFAFNFKKANTTTSLSGFTSGNISDESDHTITVTNSTAIDVGSLFCFITSASTGDVLEFDYSFTVGGVRYI